MDLRKNNERKNNEIKKNSKDRPMSLEEWWLYKHEGPSRFSIIKTNDCLKTFLNDRKLYNQFIGIGFKKY